ncbi:MAG TPA: hypothetical protein VKD24_02070 [Candidatus Angelobacter sp.]|nr:hypothetical protein [Candidatus Angelobacter sp.]
MASITRLAAASVALGLSLSGLAQATNPQISNSRTSGNSSAKTKAPVALTPQQRFVIDTVEMAVELPESDPQDRLRVLSSAATTIAPVDRARAKSIWREAAEIESELIRSGKTPVVSVMAGGQADCLAAQSFVENLPPEAVLRAEQSLIGAISSCSKHTLDPASRKLDAALEKKVVAPRALMAAMEAQGTKSIWSQQHFEKMFSALPDPHESSAEAENFVVTYAQMAGAADPDAAAKAGLQLVDWLGKMNDSPARSKTIRMAGGAIKQVLGEQRYQQALETDPVANMLLHNADQKQTVERVRKPVVSVLAAIERNGSDQSDRLRTLQPAERAREAAAHGFASGTGGDKVEAARYFDMAFAAADDVWDARSKQINAAAVVQEVGEAAAQVNSTNALIRAQKLRDSSAQAIAMLAVARVVASNGIVR